MSDLIRMDTVGGKIAVTVDVRRDGDGYRADFHGVETNAWYGGCWSAGTKRDLKSEIARYTASHGLKVSR